MEITRDIGSFFEKKLSDLRCQDETKAYIISIYRKYKTVHYDLSKDSITLQLAQGQNKQDFATYQNLGDWIFFSHTMTPSHLGRTSKEYYDAVAQRSYYSCYLLINRQWKLFEELADQFLLLEQQAKNLLSTISITNCNTSSDSYILPSY